MDSDSRRLAPFKAMDSDVETDELWESRFEDVIPILSETEMESVADAIQEEESSEKKDE